MQRGGSFKLRGALNAVLGLSDADAARGVATHSSGNHAIALAMAAAIRGVAAYVVMPNDAPRAKRDAVIAAAGRVIDCEPTLEARAAVLAEVVADTGAHEVHPYDDCSVIAGAGTVALELHRQAELDAVIAPVSGGGLLSGTAITTAGVRPECSIWGAEPAGADDAYRSLAAGRRVTSVAAGPIADGLRAELSDRTFAALHRLVEGIVTVTDDEIIAAMRMLFVDAKLVVEASGATSLAGASRLPVPVHRIGVIVSGGNLDLCRLPFLDAR
jgi:threonine dehydratase